MMPRDPVVSLCWYDLPEIREATDAWWSGVRARLVRAGLEGVPESPERSGDYQALWRSGRLLFGQACGYDVVVSYPRELRVVATPCYRTPHGDGPAYRSLMVAREGAPYRRLDDLRGARCVINDWNSHSGMNVWKAAVADRHSGGRFFSQVLVAGSHVESLAVLREGRADVAAIDCVTYALLERERPRAVAGTTVLFASDPAPAPPYVTAAAASDALVSTLRRALAEASADDALADVRRRLLLSGCRILGAGAYDEDLGSTRARALGAGACDEDLGSTRARALGAGAYDGIARIDARARALGYLDFEPPAQEQSPKVSPGVCEMPSDEPGSPTRHCR